MIETVYRSADNFQRLRSLHEELLSVVAGGSRYRRAEQELTTFMPRQGLQSQSELMIVGRAPNGWNDPWTLAEAQTPEGRARIFQRLTDEMQKPAEFPMGWVEMERPVESPWNWRRSAFSRLMHRLAGDLILAREAGWADRLIWSNLYKVAPYNGGNPGSRLCDAQLDVCVRYFQAELEIWAPKRVVIVSGWNWAEPFVASFTNRPSVSPADRFVVWSGTVTAAGKNIMIVVCTRPEMKPLDTMAEKICAAFSTLATQSEGGPLN